MFVIEFTGVAEECGIAETKTILENRISILNHGHLDKWTESARTELSKESPVYYTVTRIELCNYRMGTTER